MPQGKPTRIKPCAHCGEDFLALSSFQGVYCSYDCKALAARERYGIGIKPQPQPLTIKQRKRRLSSRLGDNEISQAVATGDRDVVMAAIKSLCDVSKTGCWIPKVEYADHPHQVIPSYQAVWIACRGTSVPLHRLSLETYRNISLGKVHCHHICAVRACCNPEHLQPATQINNTLEMRERHAYRNRIGDLESALRELNPEHPLLWPDHWSPPLTLF